MWLQLIPTCIYLHIVVIYDLRNGGDHYLYLSWKAQLEMLDTYIGYANLPL